VLPVERPFRSTWLLAELDHDVWHRPEAMFVALREVTVRGTVPSLTTPVSGPRVSMREELSHTAPTTASPRRHAQQSGGAAHPRHLETQDHFATSRGDLDVMMEKFSGRKRS